MKIAIVGGGIGGLATAKRAAGMVEAGHRTVKVKVGTNVRDDIARVRRVRSVVGDAIVTLSHDRCESTRSGNPIHVRPGEMP